MKRKRPPGLRKSAFENFYHTFGSFQNTVAAILASQVKQLQFFSEARKYDSSMEASLDVSTFPPPTSEPH